MNFQQLRIIRETVRRNFNLTEVGSALFTSQSGVSKHIKDLEDELGVELFVRKGKRLLGLTDPGKELLVLVERILHDTRNIKTLAKQYSQCDVGQLTIGATHTQARYALPRVITEFKKTFPRVHLKLHQSSPQEIVDLLLEGEADIGIATEAVHEHPELAFFPFYRWHHALVVPAGHPLLAEAAPSLARIGAHPIITYHEGFTGRTRIDRAFAEAGVTPNVVMSALDADVIKTYVELGLGVGIVASMAFHPKRDDTLALIECDQLFPENTTYLAVRRGQYLRGFAYRFIELCSVDLTEETINPGLSLAT